MIDSSRRLGSLLCETKRDTKYRKSHRKVAFLFWKCIVVTTNFIELHAESSSIFVPTLRQFHRRPVSLDTFGLVVLAPMILRKHVSLFWHKGRESSAQAARKQTLPAKLWQLCMPSDFRSD